MKKGKFKITKDIEGNPSGFYINDRDYEEKNGACLGISDNGELQYKHKNMDGLEPIFTGFPNPINDFVKWGGDDSFFHVDIIGIHYSNNFKELFFNIKTKFSMSGTSWYVFNLNELGFDPTEWINPKGLPTQMCADYFTNTIAYFYTGGLLYVKNYNNRVTIPSGTTMHCNTRWYHE
ncbi:MAG: hypothetical protein LBC39_02625 [Methanobrevibacter sp.]|jgi:hypothetical protein|nr:hypothetical protein [Candidatus Methanovirga aequatorialis]